MAVSRFQYFAPQSIEEASRLLLEQGEGAFLMAGGTDLLVKLRHGEARPRAVIGLKGIPGLDEIRFRRREGLFIGPTALLSDVATHPDIRRVYPAVAYAARSTANTQIRNMGWENHQRFEQ